VNCAAIDLARDSGCLLHAQLDTHARLVDLSAQQVLALVKSVGSARALEMMLLGERAPADTALAHGLINRVVDDENVVSEAWALASKLAQGPTMAIGPIRKQVSDALAATFDATLDAESHNQRIAKQSPDFDAAIAAFAEKRRPVFQGR
jgi:2-(1,2-epoxy-1,2-dihydrophenyl)acetyl-CoA isomerase